MGPVWTTIWHPYEQPTWANMVFVHLLHIGPLWVAHMGQRSSTQFPQILPTFPPIWAPYSFFPTYFILTSCELPIWVPDPATFSPDLAHISAFKSPVRFLSACSIRVSCGLPNWVPDPGEMEHCKTSRITWKRGVFSKKKMSFLVTMEIDYRLKKLKRGPIFVFQHNFNHKHISQYYKYHR